MIQHHHAVDHAHQHAHDVLDPDDGDAELVADLAQHVGGLLHLGVVEAAEAFVGEQQFRRGRQRLGELELLQARGAEALDDGMAVGRQADHGERAFGGLLRLHAAGAALAEIAGERDVLEDASAGETAAGSGRCGRCRG